MQSEFVATVSHEFKTPLQIIDGGREFIVRKLNSLLVHEKAIDKASSRIKNAVNRMTNLINSTLDLSKIEINQGEIIVCKIDFKIKELIEDIIDRNCHAISEKYIIIDTDIANLPELYYADQKLLDHCLSNIISNAIKYSKDNSIIKISGNIKEDDLFIKVVDSGIGIPREDLNRIGKKFFRAGNTLSMPGTGIGLYLTKHFVELHGGCVLIESKVGVGTTVVISLPR
jgi:signal transduction histidine kinase